MAKKKPYIDCTVKQLPGKGLVAAAEFACSVNPANQPPLALFAKFSTTEPESLAIAVATSKWWGSGGVNATVGFMSQASAALQEKIVRYLNLWSEHCNAKFTITGGAAQNADCRISLGAGGYYSFLGTDNARIPRNQNTMNFQGFSLSTPESEFMRVVPHEGGHYLGCPHEHARRAIIAKLHQQKTIAKFMREQGWTEAQVRQQVLTPVEEFSLMAGSSPTPDEDSSMCYGFPGDITLSGQPIIGGTRITANDGLFMGKVYPKAIVPPPPPPPPPPSAVSIVIPKAGTYVLQQ